MPPKKQRKGGDEFFYRDADGKKQDAELHNAILDEGDHEAAKAVSDKIIARVRAKREKKKAYEARAREREGEHEEESEKTEIELWPEIGERRHDFLDRCVEALTPCIGDRAEDACWEKWEASKELGKKGFVKRSMLTGDLTIESCGDTCECGGTGALVRDFDESKHPRDESGRWTDGGGDGGSSEPSSPEKMLLVSEQPNQEKLDRWHKQINDRQEELNQQNETGNREDEQLNGMSLALNAYSQEDQKNLDSGRAGLNSVYDGDGKLLAATFTDVKGDVAKIAYFGAIDADAHLKVLDQVTKAFGDKVTSIQVQRWKDDDPNSIALFEMAGFKETSKQGGLTNLSAVILEKVTRENPPSFEHLPVPIQIGEGVGIDFKSEVAAAFGSIPVRALKTMADSGIKIRAGAKLTELKPELKGEHPRGWPAGMTWDTAEGCYDRGAKEVLVSEHYRPVGKREFVPSSRIRGVALHESGHAYDQALDSPSSTSHAFLRAYMADVKLIPKEAKRGLRYFLQKGKAGRSETFAETFGWNAGAGSMRTDIRPFFPRVSKLIKDAMDRGLWLEPIA